MECAFHYPENRKRILILADNLVAILLQTLDIVPGAPIKDVVLEGAT
jgi:hypothetical protein